MIRLVRVDSCPLAVANPFSNSSLCELCVSVVKFSAGSSFEDEDDDEYPGKPRLFWVRHEHSSGLRTFAACGAVARIEQARWMTWQLWPNSFLV